MWLLAWVEGGLHDIACAPAVGVEGVVGGEAGGVALAHLRAGLDVRPLPAAQEAARLEGLQACFVGRDGWICWVDWCKGG